MENLYEICNGSLMSKFIGSKVSVIGLVSKVNPNGVSFEMRTTDDMVIKVNCREPISHPLEGYVEVFNYLFSLSTTKSNVYFIT